MKLTFFYENRKSRILMIMQYTHHKLEPIQHDASTCAYLYLSMHAREAFRTKLQWLQNKQMRNSARVNFMCMQ